MGVPSFFRWLADKYPKIITRVREEQPMEVEGGEEIPVDITKPNPNGEEFDNLYLDMNGIVHPCTHPEDRPPPQNEEEMMIEIFRVVERVVNMVRPRKLLVMAVDGVAPRAKMNQQRARRFRAVQEAEEKAQEQEEFRKLMKTNGQAEEREDGPPKKQWDSNVITPGTPFMDILSTSLRYWTAYKLSTDPGWANLKIIISDASVPGEGEHKIMEFIRSQRRQPEHDPNTRHVIYGLDADLIMLGLATHEPHFRVLREDVFAGDSRAPKCKLCGQMGHLTWDCQGRKREKQGEFDEKEKASGQKPHIWLHVPILREYLQEVLYVPNLPFQWDLERAIDDYVFLCFFCGNDFLPHLPSLSIKEEGIDTLIAVWKDNLALMGGYVTKDGNVDLEKVQFLVGGLAKQEDAIFKRRREVDLKRDANQKRRKLEQDRRNGRGNGNSQNQQDTPNQKKGRKGRGSAVHIDDIPMFAPGDVGSQNFMQQARDQDAFKKEIFQAQVQTANKSAAAVIKEQLLRRQSSGNLEAETEVSTPQSVTNAEIEDPKSTPGSGLGKKRKAEALDDEDNGTPGRNTPLPGSGKGGNGDEAPPDNVRLWEDGYADRYYEKKFGADPNDLTFRHTVAYEYLLGCCWVLKYYMQGCPSWTWFYPYHYAPFAADFVDTKNQVIKFDHGKPFRPYEQLMGVLPAASNHAIPAAFHPLMENEDSPIIDFYPADFPLDLNGKKFAWQAVVLLPFIDEKRLLDAMATKYPLLTDAEKARNEIGREELVFSSKHPMHAEILSNFYSKKKGTDTYQLDAKTSQGLLGEVEKLDSFMPMAPLQYPLENQLMPDLDQDGSMSVKYEMPHSNNTHKSQLLRGVVMPSPALERSDLDFLRNRNRNAGRSYGGAPLNHGGGGRRGDDRGSGQGGGPINYANPFAAHLNPSFAPPPQNMPAGFPGPGGLPPPPHVAAQYGWVPPPPPNFNQGRAPGPSNSGPPHDRQGGGYDQRSYNNGNQGYGGNQNYGGGYGNGHGNGYSNQGYQHQGYQGNGSNQPRDDRNYGQSNYNRDGRARDDHRQDDRSQNRRGGGGGYQGGRNDGYRGGNNNGYNRR